MQPEDVDEKMCNYEDYYGHSQRYTSYKDDSWSAQKCMQLADDLAANNAYPIKNNEDEEWQPNRSSEPMEDNPRPLQLPRSLDYLGDWRYNAAVELRLSASRLSMGSSMGEQRIGFVDGFNAFPSIDVPSLVEKAQTTPFEGAGSSHGPYLLPLRLDESSKIDTLAYVQKEAQELKAISEEHAAEISTKADSSNSPTPVTTNSREEMLESEVEDEVEIEKENDVPEKTGDAENNPRAANVVNNAPEGEKKVSGTDKKKCCNCKKSRCLKLYCECFASQEFCAGCNCVDCHNTEEHNEEKKAAMARVNTKNPYGFLRRLPALKEQIVGCNCKRSSCQRNYCCCFKKGAKCGSLCKCVSCNNQTEILAGDKENVNESNEPLCASPHSSQAE